MGKGNMDQVEEGGSYKQQLRPQALLQKQGLELPGVFPPNFVMNTLCIHVIHKY